MITLGLIIIIIIAIVSYNKKDKRPANADAQISQLPPIRLCSSQEGTGSRFISGELFESDSNVLREFRHEHGNISIVMKNGKTLSAPLRYITVRAEKVGAAYTLTVSYSNNKITISKIGNFSSTDWDTIIGVLSLAGTTYGMEIFGSTYKNISRAATVAKIISKL